MYSIFSILYGFGAVVSIIMFAAAIGLYVLNGYSHMKALAQMGYDKPWMAWIPFANTYACMEVVSGGQDSVRILNNFDIPVMVYKLWWIALFIAPFIPVIGSLLSVALRVVFMGDAYAKMYSALERKPIEDCRAIGYVSGFINIIASIKFLTNKTSY